ncbi:hypothetical protein BGX31_004770, partial [Mortierella sp. GBA43]
MCLGSRRTQLTQQKHRTRQKNHFIQQKHRTRQKNYFIQQKHRVWCNKVLESGGKLDARKFAEAFSYGEEEAAYCDYSRLLDSEAIEERHRQSLKKELLDWKRKNRKSKTRGPSEKGKEVDTRPLFREGTVENDLQSDFTLFPEDSLESDGVAGSLFPEAEPEDEEGHEDEKEDHEDNGDNDQDGDGDGDEGDSQITAPFESL